MKLDKLRITLSSFETLTENNANELVGGFSKSFSDQSSVLANTLANNCYGGNCTQGCGSGQNTQLCNTYFGCGN